MCTCGTVGYPFEFWCSSRGIGSLLFNMMGGERWGSRHGARPGWKYMSTFGSTLGGGTGAAYRVASMLSTLRVGVGGL